MDELSSRVNLATEALEASGIAIADCDEANGIVHVDGCTEMTVRIGHDDHYLIEAQATAAFATCEESEAVSLFEARLEGVVDTGFEVGPTSRGPDGLWRYPLERTCHGLDDLARWTALISGWGIDVRE